MEAWPALVGGLCRLFQMLSLCRFYAQSRGRTSIRATLARVADLFHHPALIHLFQRGQTMSKQINWYYFRKG